MYSLLQVYSKVHGVSSIFHLKVFLVPVCARGFGYLRCWPRGRGIGLVCTRRFSSHEFYNFLLFNFLILIFFLEDFFFAHDNYPHPQPTPTTFSYTPGVRGSTVPFRHSITRQYVHAALGAHPLNVNTPFILFWRKSRKDARLLKIQLFVPARIG